MKTSREKVLEVFERRSGGDGVMWTGNPDWEIVEAASKKWGIECSNEGLFNFFNASSIGFREITIDVTQSFKKS